jgi:hypothetical protein
MNKLFKVCFPALLAIIVLLSVVMPVNITWQAGHLPTVRFTPEKAYASTTVSYQISASADDAYTASGAITLTGSSLQLDGTSSTVRNVYGRFLNVTIPQGATITAASIDLKSNNAYTGASNIIIYGILEADTATFSTAADADGRSLTTAHTHWAMGNWANATWYGATNDPQEIKDVIQEIVNQGSWASGNDLAIKSVSVPTGIVRSCYGWDSGLHDSGMKLNITYELTASLFTSTISALQVTSTNATLSGNITALGSSDCVLRGFQWGETSGALSENWTESGNFTVGNFTHDITGLTPDTPIYYRTVAQDSTRTAYGDENVFRPGTWTLVFIPDPQNMTSDEPAMWLAENTWIAGQNSTLNIKIAMTAGDLGDSNNRSADYVNANAGFDILTTAGIPWLPVPGNHDYTIPLSNNLTMYNTYFPESDFTGFSWFGEGYPGGTTNSNYALLNIFGTDYIFIELMYLPSEAALTWMDGLLTTYSTYKAIISTHAYQNTDGTYVIPPHDDIWNVLKTHDNVRMILSGHMHTPPDYENMARTTVYGDSGNAINEIQFDMQDDDHGNGWVRYYVFLNDRTVEAYSYSVDDNSYNTAAYAQFEFVLDAVTTGGAKAIIIGAGGVLVIGCGVAIFRIFRRRR